MACFDVSLKFLKSDSLKNKRYGLELLKKACKLGNDDACDFVEQGEKIVSLSEELADPVEEQELSASSMPVKTTFAGIEWVVSGELSPLFKIKKVTCETTPTKYKLCSINAQLPNGWDRHQGLVTCAAFTEDDVQIRMATIYPGEAAEGVVIEDQIRVDKRAVRVEMGLRTYGN